MGLLKKMTYVVDSVGKDVSKAAKDTTEVAKCSAVIQECEERVNTSYMELGRQYYEADAALDEDIQQTLFDTIRQNLQVIEEKRSEIRALKGIEVCAKCGSELKKDANFCNVCGTRVERISTAPANRLNCVCGAVLNGTEKYCAKCGTKVEQTEALNVPGEKQARYCRECGQELKENDLYCKYCGTKQEE